MRWKRTARPTSWRTHLWKPFRFLAQRPKGGLTAAQLSRSLPHWQDRTTRRDFYNAACSAILAIDASSKRARRSQTREAIFRTLEQFELILRTRGELKNGYVKRDRIS